MPISWVINIGGVIALLAGLQGLWIGFSNYSPAKLTCAEYMATPSSADWLELTDCRINYLEAVKTFKKLSTLERSVAYYAPVRAYDDETKLVILIAKAPENVAQLLEPLFRHVAKQSGASGPTEDEVLAQHGDELVQSHATMKGLILRGMDSSSDLRELLEKDQPASWKLERDWRLLDQSAAPSLIKGALLLLLGLVILVWRLFVYAGRAAAVTAVKNQLPEKIAELGGPRE
ncbi:MAG: hypothetical protein ABI612_24980 [Betaproteobacteria bacterium]